MKWIGYMLAVLLLLTITYLGPKGEEKTITTEVDRVMFTQVAIMVYNEPYVNDPSGWILFIPIHRLIQIEDSATKWTL